MCACGKVHLVFLKVGFLQDNGYAIGQFQLGVTQFGILLFLDNLTGTRQLGHQWHFFHRINVGFYLGLACGMHSLQQGFGRRIYVTFLLVVEVDDNHITIGFGQQLRQYGVDVG